MQASPKPRRGLRGNRLEWKVNPDWEEVWLLSVPAGIIGWNARSFSGARKSASRSASCENASRRILIATSRQLRMESMQVHLGCQGVELSSMSDRGDSRTIGPDNSASTPTWRTSLVETRLCRLDTLCLRGRRPRPAHRPGSRTPGTDGRPRARAHRHGTSRRTAREPPPGVRGDFSRALRRAIYTNDKAQLGAALDRDVSHRAAIEPTRAPAAPAQTIERSPAHQHGIGFGHTTMNITFRRSRRR
jgi:hypothetical protein